MLDINCLGHVDSFSRIIQIPTLRIVLLHDLTATLLLVSYLWRHLWARTVVSCGLLLGNLLMEEISLLLPELLNWIDRLLPDLTRIVILLF